MLRLALVSVLMAARIARSSPVHTVHGSDPEIEAVLRFRDPKIKTLITEPLLDTGSMLELRIPVEFDHVPFEWNEKTNAPGVEEVQAVVDAFAEWGARRAEQMLQHVSPVVLEQLRTAPGGSKVRLMSPKKWERFLKEQEDGGVEDEVEDDDEDEVDSALGPWEPLGLFFPAEWFGENLVLVKTGRVPLPLFSRGEEAGRRSGEVAEKYWLEFQGFPVDPLQCEKEDSCEDSCHGTSLPFRLAAAAAAAMRKLVPWQLQREASPTAQPAMQPFLERHGDKWKEALFRDLDNRLLDTLVHELGHLVHSAGMKGTAFWNRFEHLVAEYEDGRKIPGVLLSRYRLWARGEIVRDDAKLFSTKEYAATSEDYKSLLLENNAHEEWYKEARIARETLAAREFTQKTFGGKSDRGPYVFVNKFEFWAVLTEAWFNSGSNSRKHNAGIFSRQLVRRKFPKLAELMGEIYGDKEEFAILSEKQPLKCAYSCRRKWAAEKIQKAHRGNHPRVLVQHAAATQAMHRENAARKNGVVGGGDADAFRG